jgi:hypothetical protein
MKVAYVKWIDSAIQRGQVRRDELGQLSVIETVGLLVAVTKDAITITRDSMDDGDVRDVIHIPWINVYEYRVGRAKALKRSKVK